MQDISSKYHNMGKLGTGNFGTVYMAKNQVVDRIEAVKIIPNVSQITDKETVEARVLHKLQHDNVTEIFDAFIRNDKLYILMEYLEGGSVHSIMRKRKLTVKECIKIGIDALYGMQFIHNKGYIHRDIKPSNILLDKRGMAKLSDFGLISELDSDGKYTSSFGYRLHKAPEIYTKGECSKLSDIFSMGLTLYRMVNGDDFMKKFDRQNIAQSIISGDFPPKNEYSPDVPKKLKQIINCALSLDPDDRYKNAHSMRSDLSRINVPIEWTLSARTPRKMKWIGKKQQNNYMVEVQKSIIGGNYIITVKKGTNKLRNVTKLCCQKSTEKKMYNQLNKILNLDI